MIAVLDLQAALESYVAAVLPAIVGLMAIGAVAVVAWLAVRGGFGP